MNWARNHIVYTEEIEGINHSSRQTVSSHQDNTDSFVVSDEELESVEVLVFDSSREVFGDEMILF